MTILHTRYELRNDHRLPAPAGNSRSSASSRTSPELTRAELRDIILGLLG